MQTTAASTRSLLSSLMKAAPGSSGFHVAVAGIPVEDCGLREELRLCRPAGLVLSLIVIPDLPPSCLMPQLASLMDWGPLWWLKGFKKMT